MDTAAERAKRKQAIEKSVSSQLLAEREALTKKLAAAKDTFLARLQRPLWPGSPITLWQGTLGALGLAAVALGVTVWAGRRPYRGLAPAARPFSSTSPQLSYRPDGYIKYRLLRSGGRREVG